MSGWDSPPPDLGDDTWDEAGIPPPPQFRPDAGAPVNTAEYTEGAADADSDQACRYCKLEGHFARECPTRPTDKCFNCGEEGHRKVDCTNERVFTGTCRICEEEGHQARDCPQKPADICRHCREEGHFSATCPNPRFIDKTHIKTKTPEQAWNGMLKYSKGKDIEKFRKRMAEYMKATPGCTWDSMEKAFRDKGFKFWLYALSPQLNFSQVVVGPNGETDAIWKVTLNVTAKPRRSKALGSRIAPTPEENMKRLMHAGEVMADLKPFCMNCKEKGHSAKTCEIENDYKPVVLSCNLCGGLDHRVRDCTKERKPDYNPMACRNCGIEGHKASECEAPRVANATTECRICAKLGHFSADCPDKPVRNCFNCGQGGHNSNECTNEKVLICRNCDGHGHFSKDCDKPRDMARIKCNRCQQMGHFESRCNEPAPETIYEYAETNGADGGTGGNWPTAQADNFSW